MGINLKSKTSRRQLEPRREPYWSRLSKGVYVGYRVAQAGKGTWIARMRGDDGRQTYYALGTFDDFDEASKATIAWSESVAQGVKVFDATVGDACHAYLDFLRMHRAATTVKWAEGSFKRLVFGKAIERIPLAKLQTLHVHKWLNAQVDLHEDDEDIRSAKVTANRNLDGLKAALNMALANRLVATDAGWKTVKRFQKVSRRRERFLSLEERAKLLEHCEPDFRSFCEALLLTGARPGELANADLVDFDAVQGTLTLEGKTGRRTVSLSTAAIRHFKEASQNRIGRQPLLLCNPAQRWDKERWKRAMKKAVRAAQLPDDVVVYSLRHAAISEFIIGGMDSFIVAKLTGTSTDMIDRHYGHLRHDKTRARMDQIQML